MYSGTKTSEKPPIATAETGNHVATTTRTTDAVMIAI
jgi:hypothetical protein